MAPRRGGGSYRGSSSSSGSSPSCRGCNDPLETPSLGFVDPYVAAALAFAMINLVAFFVLLIPAITTKRLVRPSNAMRTRHGLSRALLAILCFQIFNVAIIIVQNQTFVVVRRSFLITLPFAGFFQYASEVFVVGTIFGVIRSRLQALDGDTKHVKRMRTVAIVLVSVLAAVGIFWIAIYCYLIALTIDDYGAAFPLRSNVAAARAALALTFAYLALELMLSVFFIVMAVNLRKVYSSHAVKSKIPIYLLALVTPWYFIRSLCTLFTNAMAIIMPYPSFRVNLVVFQITYGSLSVLIFAGLILCARQSEFSTLDFPRGPSHFFKNNSHQSNAPVSFSNHGQCVCPQHQQQQQQQPYTTSNDVPFTGGQQFQNLGNTSTSHGNGQGHLRSVPHSGIPLVQPGSPLPITQQQ